jgi:hypothetical protein
MSQFFSVEIESLIEFPNFKISEGKFLTVLAQAERYFKDKLEHENIRCKRCQLIVGREFKLGVVIPSALDPKKNLNFFAAHSMCIDDRLNEVGNVTEESDLEVSALTFLDVEKEFAGIQGDLDSHLNMMDIEKINGEFKVLLKYEKAGTGSKEMLSQAALIRFGEIEKLGGTVICPMCQKGFKKGHEKFVAFIGNGPKKDANIEMVHNHCGKKFRKLMGGRT